MLSRASLLSFFILCGSPGTAQDLRPRGERSGLVSLGVRSGASFFNNGDARDIGQAVGGQFRVQLARRVNTDWFLDLLTAPVGDRGSRRDLHVGWSVLYYLREPVGAPAFLQPYVLAGHCFDRSHRTTEIDGVATKEPWSSAVQAGLGTHLNITERFDVSPVLQYMIHLGGPHDDGDDTGSTSDHGTSLEGHLLFTVSMNWKLFDAW